MTTKDPIRGAMPRLCQVPRHAPTRVVFPRRNPESGKPYLGSALLTPWCRSAGKWWTFHRGIITGHEDYQRLAAARVYVNGSGQDHELRFYVDDVRYQEFASVDEFRSVYRRSPRLLHIPDCPRCNGTGKVTHTCYVDEEDPGGLITALGGKPRKKGDTWTTTCTAIQCRQGVVQRYGAANDFQYTPGIETYLPSESDPFTRRVGSRGLYGFRKDEVLAVMHWIDNEILPKLYPPIPTRRFHAQRTA